MFEKKVPIFRSDRPLIYHFKNAQKCMCTDHQPVC